MMVKTQSNAIQEELDAKSKEHAEVKKQRNLARELKLQLEQLEYYKAGVRSIANPLAKLAEIVPLRVQLREPSVRPPAPQVLLPPNVKIPLFGLGDKKVILADYNMYLRQIKSPLHEHWMGYRSASVMPRHRISCF